MKIIFKIALAELRTLFYSPIAWLMLILFFFSSAGTFCFLMEKLATMQEVKLDADADWAGFDMSITQTTGSTVLGVLKLYIFMFIPLLTMGVISREMNSGTIRLLYSSPVNTREIVLGKYLGLFFYNCILTAVIGVQLLALCMIVENPQINWCLSMLLGIFLMINTYSAIGLFMSSLTNYQIVAAMITFAVLFVLERISTVWQQYDLIRDITWSLSISGKIDRMLNGLITSREILYFLSVIMLFLGFAIIRLQSTQESKKWTTRFAQYMTLLLVMVLIQYFSARPRNVLYADVTKQQLNTLHPVVRDAMEQMDGAPLTVTLYVNLLNKAMPGLPQNRNRYLQELWEPFIRVYPNIQFRYEYYYDATKQKRASLSQKFPGKTLDELAALETDKLGIRFSLFKKPEEMRKKLDLRDEDYDLVMQLEYKDRKTLLRTFGSPLWPPQRVVAASIDRLTREKEVTVAFLTGHFERDPFSHTSRDYGYHTSDKSTHRSLINNGVDIDTVSLASRRFPGKADLLVVADPKSPYSASEQQTLINYLDNGGNALFFAEPGKQHILAPVLEHIGVTPDNGILVTPSKHEMPQVFVNPLTRAGNFLAKEPQMEFFQASGKGGGMVFNDGMINLSYREVNGFKVEPIITSPGDNNTWIETGVFRSDSAAPVYAPAEGDFRKDEYVIALKLTRTINNREQRIIVAGDADFMSKIRMRRIGIELALYSWLLYNKYPYYVNFPLPEDDMLKLTPESAGMMKKILVYLIPLLLIFTAIVLLLRRKRK